MKKYLLPEGGSFYKANLHCHSTYSDGEYSPAEILPGDSLYCNNFLDRKRKLCYTIG